MSTLPTPSTSLGSVHVSYTINSGEIFQEFDFNQDVATRLTDSELDALLTTMDAGVLAHATDPGQIRRHVSYNFTGNATVSTTIRAS